MITEDILYKERKWNKSDYNRWADFIELCCYFSSDRFISYDDVVKILCYDILENGSQDHSTKYDSETTRIISYFDLIKYREETLGDAYPFILDEDLCLSLNDKIHEKAYYYFFFLIASNTCFVNKSMMNKITLKFEKLCCNLLSVLQPNGAITEVFGTSREKEIYTGSLRKRITAIAKNLNTYTTKPFDEDNQYDIPSGDNGIDLITYYNIDGNAFMPFSFGQCSCSYDQWRYKQDSISFDKWNKRIDNLIQFSGYMFVPFDCRMTSGRFERNTDISTILIDRHRLFILIDKCIENEVSLESINEILDEIFDIQTSSL